MITSFVCCLIILPIVMQILLYMNIGQYQNNTNNSLFEIHEILSQGQILDLSQSVLYRQNTTLNNVFIKRSNFVNSLKYNLVKNRLFKNQCISLGNQYDILNKMDIKNQSQQKILKIFREALNKLFCQYDQEQDYIFMELQIISKMILKNNYYEEIYQDRNILHNKMVDILNKNKNTNLDYLSKQNDSKSHQNFKILSMILKKLQFNRFLRVDVKFDRLEFMINYLNEHWFQKNPIIVVGLAKQVSFLKFLLKDIKVLSITL